MKIGIVNEPQNDLIDEIKWIVENGFDFLDLSIEPLKAYDIDVNKLKKVLKESKLSAVGHTNPFLPCTLPIPSIRKVCYEEFEKYVNIFSMLGIKLMNIHPSYVAVYFSNEDKIRENINFIKQVNMLCKSKGITLMLENFLAPFDTPEVFSRILKAVPGLMMHLDVGHCNINQKKNLTEDFFKKFGKKIVHVHFSDNKGKDDSHLPLGCGNIDWEEIVRILKKYGYDGTITLEIFSPDKNYILLSRDKLKNLWHC